MNSASAPYWSQNSTELMAGLDSTADGLASLEAEVRLQRVGANTVESENGETPARLMLRQLESPLVRILLFAVIVSLVLRDWVDALRVLLIVVGSSVVGFVQEYRASLAVAALRRRVALVSRVRRDGEFQTIPASRVVPGDVISQTLVAGVDVWLNTPVPPLEASGTSGMKAAFNGLPQLSVLDGWWIEACIEGVTGWAIGDTSGADDAAQALYDKLEDVVLPLYPGKVMKGAIAKNASQFNSHRMMRRYAAEAYIR